MVILCFHFFGYSQLKKDQNLPDIEIFQKEITRLTVNSNLLLAGESLFYKTYNFTEQNELSSLSKIMYISLRNEKDSIIFNHKLLLKNGLGNGSMFIPANVESGEYRLIAYTNFSLNNIDHPIFQKSIYIINPFSKSHTNTISKSNSSNTIKLSLKENTSKAPNSPSQIGNITLKTNKENYDKREKISLLISNPTSDLSSGNYSISVRKTSSIAVSDSTSTHQKSAMNREETFFIPEVRGEIISGKLTTSHSNLKIENKQVAFSLQGERYLFKTTVTNSEGQFFIVIDEPYQTENCILQVLGSDKEKYNITLDDKRFKFETKNNSSELFLSPTLKDYLQERSTQIQIQNAYFDPENRVPQETLEYEPFYGSIGNKYVLDDYTRFSTFRETCIEIVTMIKVSDLNNTVSLEVFDPFSTYKDSPFSIYEPLIIMDGVLVQDPMDVYSFNMKSVETIHVYGRPYRLGGSVFQGIVDIKTKKGGFKPSLLENSFVEFELESLVAKNVPYMPVYSDHSLDRIPDYRVQLFWDPNIALDSKETIREMYSSDVSGQYVVTLEGYSSTGEYVFSTYNFVVN